MHLVVGLIGGIRGAENGTALFTKRGSAAPSTVYGTFEGSDPDSSGSPVQLDSSGAVEIYVDTLTTVVVHNAFGVPVREFVAGVSSSSVEVRSKSFTGQEYGDASGIKPAGPGQPATLQSIADRWLEVNGAPDWKVGDGTGKSFSIQDLVAALIHQTLDVTAPQFGAVGDGLNDDLEAFVAADAEATARGGGVLLVPASSAYYRWSAPFLLGAKNSMLGLGVDNSIIQIDAAQSGMITLGEGADGDAGRYIKGLTFRGNVLNGAMLEFSTSFVLEGCVLRDTGVSVSNLIAPVFGVGFLSGILSAIDCRFELFSPTGAVLAGTVAAHEVVFERCRFVTPVGTYTGDMFKGYKVKLNACSFAAPPLVANGGNNFSVFKPIANGSVTLTGCEVSIGNGDDSGNGTLLELANASIKMRESDSVYAIAERIVDNGGGLASYSSVPGLRGDTQASGTNFATGTPAEVESRNHTQIQMTRTSSADFTFGMESASGLDGSFCSVLIQNFSGGNISTVTPGAFTSGKPETISSGNTRTWLFRATGSVWIQMAETVGF